MKTAIIGVGAMGSVYAGLIADAGNEVWAIDLWQEHIDAIAAKGLRVEGASGDRVVSGMQVTSNAADAGLCDLVIIATKADGVASAAKAAAAIMGPRSVVLAIQNGLGAAERICEHVAADKVLLGVAEGFGASMKGPGHVHHNGMTLIRLGDLSGGISARLEQVEKLWRDAGFNVKSFADINQLIWEKFVCNVGFSAPCTIFNRTVGEMKADPHSWKVVIGCGSEAYQAGYAKGIAFSYDDPEAYITGFANKVLNARPSMLLDHLARRRSEIDVINGMVPVVAAEVGTPAPYNEVVSAIVRAREIEF